MSDSNKSGSSCRDLNSRQQQADIRENLLGIFVVSFDTKRGNTVEWQIPQELRLERIEFKAMASGFHLIQNDLVYFSLPPLPPSHNDMYGLAAFQSQRIDSSEERNVRMKSVGLIAKSYKFLRKYVTFLKNQVKHLLDTPGDYASLISLWTEKRVCHPADFSLFEFAALVPPTMAPLANEDFLDKVFFSKRSNLFKQVILAGQDQIDYRLFSKFALYFGASIFSIWKYALLNKRLLFYSAPPINDLCSRVICSSEMISTNFNYVTKRQMLRPYFYVNVTDIESLQEQPFFSACTSERIFESKEFLYDLFIKDSELKAVLADSQKNLLKVNSYDKKRYDLLLKKINEIPNKPSKPTNEYNQVNLDEEMFMEFFIDLNDRIFTILFEVETIPANKSCEGNEKVPNIVTSEHIKQMGLDPVDDKDFLNELIRFYDFNLVINST
jgi:hypothetical protein